MRKFEEICHPEIVEKIRANDPSLKVLELRGGRPCPDIKDEDMATIIQELCNNSHITSLILAENSLTNKGLIHINLLKNIKSLDLSDNCLNDEALESLSKMDQLIELYLCSNEISGKNLKVLFENLKNLEILELTGEVIMPVIKDIIPGKLKVYVNGHLQLHLIEKIFL